MDSQSLSVVIPANHNAVFNYLAEIENLPDWATEFCRELIKENGYYRVVTPMGEMNCDIRSDRHTGVIDFYTSSDGVEFLPLISRVFSLPHEQSIYTVTFFKDEDVSEELYQQQLGSIRKELDNIRQRFNQG